MITDNAPYQYLLFELINLSLSGLSKLVRNIKLSSLFYFTTQFDLGNLQLRRF